MFSIGLFIFFRMYSKSKFSDTGLDKAITTASKMRDITGDPCMFSIFGDPMGAGDMYAKLNYYCPGGKHSNNSVDLRAVRGTSIIDLFYEVGRINGFKVSLINKTLEFGDMKDKGGIDTWNCIIGTEKIVDFESPIKKSSNIDCFYGMSKAEMEIIKNGKN